MTRKLPRRDYRKRKRRNGHDLQFDAYRERLRRRWRMNAGRRRRWRLVKHRYGVGRGYEHAGRRRYRRRNFLWKLRRRRQRWQRRQSGKNLFPRERTERGTNRANRRLKRMIRRNRSPLMLCRKREQRYRNGKNELLGANCREIYPAIQSSIFSMDSIRTLFSSSSSSSGLNLESTQSAVSKRRSRPIPIFTRANSSVPNRFARDFNPFCPPELPFSRKRTFQKSMSMSSETAMTSVLGSSL